jgi:hypothetical protein
MAHLMTQRSIMADAMAALHSFSQLPENQGLTLIEMSWAVRYHGGSMDGEIIGDGSQTLAAAASQFTREHGHRCLTCVITLLNGHSRRFTAYAV